MTDAAKKRPMLKLPKLLRFEQAWHDEQNQLGDKILAEVWAERMASGKAIGQRFKEEGVFLCHYEPKDRDGISLGKIFNVLQDSGVSLRAQRLVRSRRYILRERR